jgi:hypothetical protein
VGVIDRRKRIEEAAEIHLGRINWVTSPRDVTAAFSAGAEWADKTNAEIPPLASALYEAKELLRRCVKHWGDYAPTGGNARKTLDDAKAFLDAPWPTETPSPTTEGSEDRGTY